ncbi:MAG: Ada metal-binding domain-containing protein [Bryobacteraceae bacterium]
MAGPEDPDSIAPALDHAACYRALQARDPRFDGHFFTAVRTTGIFCRPVCPATTPKRANCEFYPSSAAALSAGFRPCLRCRPETAPEFFDGLGTARSLQRALRLIDEGALDRGSVAALAGRLGIGDRHLRRLFRLYLGASPHQVAHARRILFARHLLSTTSLPVSGIALEAGFRSLRTFQEAFQKCFRCTPRQMRRNRSGHDPHAIVLHLGFSPPYEWDGVIGFLAPRAIPGVELVTADSYCRTFRLGDHTGRIEVRRPAANTLAVRIAAPHPRGLREITRRVAHLFDLHAQPASIAQHLGDLAITPGLRVPGAWDPFELAVRAILGQQISVKGATTIAGRITAAFGTPLQPFAGEPSLLFPEPAALAAADLTSVGLTRARAATVGRLAEAVLRGEIPFDDPAHCVRALLALPGVGDWTAQYIAMRALREPDAFPSGDLGLRKAVSDGGPLVSAAGLEALSARWRPWRAYAAFHLWSTL